MTHEYVLPFKKAVNLHNYCVYIFIKRVELTLSVFMTHTESNNIKEEFSV